MVIRTSINQIILYITCFLYFAVGDLSRLFGVFGIPKAVTYALFLLFLALHFGMNMKAIRAVDIFYYLLIIPLTAYGVYRNGRYIDSINRIFVIILVFLPAYPFFRSLLGRENALEKCSTAAGWFSAFFLIPYYFLVIRGNVIYSMEYAYWISFPICMLSPKAIKEKKILNILIVGIMYGSLLLAGCRGALLLTTVYIMAFYGLEILSAEKMSRKLLYLFLIFAVLIAAALNINLILSFLSRFSRVSRNINKLLEGNYLDTTSRDYVYGICRSLISENPWGYGPLASRRLLVGHNYPHSLFYELQLDIGKYLGILVFGILMFMTAANVLGYRKSEAKAVVGYISIVGMGSLMVSGSFYYELYVLATVALYVNLRVLKRRKRAQRLMDQTASA